MCKSFHPIFKKDMRIAINVEMKNAESFLWKWTEIRSLLRSYRSKSLKWQFKYTKK